MTWLLGTHGGLEKLFKICARDQTLELYLWSKKRDTLLCLKDTGDMLAPCRPQARGPPARLLPHTHVLSPLSKFRVWKWANTSQFISAPELCMAAAEQHSRSSGADMPGSSGAGGVGKPAACPALAPILGPMWADAPQVPSRRVWPQRFVDPGDWRRAQRLEESRYHSYFQGGKKDQGTIGSSASPRSLERWWNS